MEKYKDIAGYEGLYQVTTWGRVWSVRKNCFVTPEITKKGYLRVYLYDQTGRRKHYKVHRLVANAFIQNPDGKRQVNHIDGNKQNNSFTNIEWVTDAENKAHQRMMYEREICIPF